MIREEVSKPVPLLTPGMFVDCPEPRWKLKSPKERVDVKSLQGTVVRLCDLPLPPVSRLIFQAGDPSTVQHLQEYVQHVLEPRIPGPEWIQRSYPGRVYLAHSLKQADLLHFDSHFECGNLSRAYAVNETEYDLYLNSDTNTKGHTQWFFFSVSNVKAGVETRFNIVNFTKGNCLLARGLRPCFQAQSEGQDWHKVSSEVSYYRSGFERGRWKRSSAVDEEEEEGTRHHWYYTLSFSHTFSASGDTVFFAFSEPYGFSKLKTILEQLERNISTESISYEREVLCESTLGLDVDILSITAPKGQGQSLHKRQGVVFTARVHPGESITSFIMEELIRFLLSDSDQAKALRGTYVFKLIPMLNPDGVVLGNYRSCVEGVDLNRRWASEDTQHFPTLRILKEAIQSFGKDRKIAMFCDLHGHAKKNNSFIYGCNTASEGGFTTWTKVRLLPRVFARLSPYFNYEACKFKVQKEKLGTARVVVWKELGVSNSFTLETSFHGYKRGTEICEFSAADYSSLADHLLISLLHYSHLITQFDKEVATNGGWLKPGKLKEMTGIPAQQVLLIEQEAHQKQERYRQARISNSLTTTFQDSRTLRSISAKQRKDTRAKTYKDSQINYKRTLKRKPETRPDQPEEDWRDYFSSEEMQSVWKQLKEGKEFEESESSGSDSSPSEDNLSEVDRDWMSVQKALREEISDSETFISVVETTLNPIEPEEEFVSPPMVAIKSPKSSVHRQKLPILSHFSPRHAKMSSDVPQPVLESTRKGTPYPVSDTSTLVRKSLEMRRSFDRPDFTRPRIHMEPAKSLTTTYRNSSPLFFIESLGMKRPDRKPREQKIEHNQKALSTGKRLEVQNNARSAYSSKAFMAATTRYGFHTRYSRKEFLFPGKKPVKVTKDRPTHEKRVDRTL